VTETAQVRINDKLMRSSGTRRVFYRDLEPGSRYRYRIEVKERAAVVRDEFVVQAGKTKTLLLKGNQLAAR
jgi:hypothetical protein